MPKFTFPRGATSKRVLVFIEDTSASDGRGLTGLVYNSAGLIAYYKRPADAAATVINLATAVLGTWTSGGFKEVHATNMRGVYEFGIPDACLAAGAGQVAIMLRGAANMPDVYIEIQLGHEMPPVSQARDTSTVEGQMRTVHSLVGGNKISRNHGAATAAVVARNEDDSANLVTGTRTVVGSVETVTPS